MVGVMTGRMNEWMNEWTFGEEEIVSENGSHNKGKHYHGGIKSSIFREWNLDLSPWNQLVTHEEQQYSISPFFFTIKF